MTDLEMLRQNIRDTGTPPKFDDLTLTDLLARYDNDVNLASAQVWLWYAGDASLRNFKFRIGDQDYDQTMTADECRQMAERFRQLAAASGGAAVAEIEWTDAFTAVEDRLAGGW